MAGNTGTKGLAGGINTGGDNFEQSHVGLPPFYRRVVVHEVLFDPDLLTDEKLEELRPKVRFTQNLRNLPRNSIIGERIRTGQTDVGGWEIFFPFFPPHLGLPVKPGEQVWVFFEDPEMVESQGFWMSRVSEVRNVDDVNLTHADRKFDRRSGKSTADKAAGGSPPPPGFNNGVVGQLDGTDVSMKGTGSITGGPDAYKKIHKTAEAAKAHDYEAVPRFTKRPGDTVIQGSNNSLLALTTDRSGAAAVIKDGKVDKLPDDDQRGGAGTAIISVGRGRKPKTSGKTVKNALDKQEQDKGSPEDASEGNIDFENDAATFYLSMKTKADKNFKIKHSKHKSDSKEVASAAVVKADQLRFVAREDIKFLVKFDESTPDDKCAMFILTKSGDIVLLPSKDGFVKMGGEDADKAILCTRAGVTKTGGKVKASPIVDTMGGSQGGSDGLNGTFAEKCLMK